MTDFNALGLRAELLRAVAGQGYTAPTPIQAQAIPAVIAGGDVMAAAQTGTGKTAAFTLPLLHRLSENAPGGKRRPVRALVLTPTRELAAQVGESVATYGGQLPLRSMEIFGGVKINPQIDKLRRGVDILVATPGRLLDHVGQGTVDLSRVEVLVLDEADRMLDMGFIHDIRRVMRHLPEKRQTLLFSATFSSDIRKLASGLLKNPTLVEIAPKQTTAERIDQVIHPVDKGRKQELLSWLIGDGNWQQVLVFTRTKHGANKLTTQLEKDGITAAAIHGNKSQGARTRALANFKDGKIRALVATDIAARGLDIDQLPHVVNFELPNVPEDYVHRIGRTGRAGNAGRAVSLVSGEERKLLRDIEKVLRASVPREVIQGYEPDPSKVEPTLEKPGRGRRQGQHRGKGNGGQASRQGHRSAEGAGRGNGGQRRRRRPQRASA